MFFATSLRVVPNNPPYVAVMTLFGSRMRAFKEDGLRLFPLAPWVYDGILVDVSKKSTKISNDVQTPDLASLKVEGSITWTPMKEYAVEYLENGGHKAVDERLRDFAHDGIRNWAMQNKGSWRNRMITDQDTYVLMSQIIADLPSGLTGDIAPEYTDTFEGRRIVEVPDLGIAINRISIERIIPAGMRGYVTQASEQGEARAISREVEAGDVDALTILIAKVAQVLDVTPTEAHTIIQGERDKMSLEKKLYELKPDVDPEDLANVVKLFDRAHE